LLIIIVNQWSSTNSSGNLTVDVRQLSFFHIIWYFNFFLVGCQPSAWTNNLQPTIFLSCQMSIISVNQWSSTNYLSFILSGISICRMSTISVNQWSSTNYLSFLSDVNHQCEPMIFNQLSFFHIIWYFIFLFLFS